MCFVADARNHIACVEYGSILSRTLEAHAERRIMKCAWIVAAAMLLPAGLGAQNALPGGTILPVSLLTGLNVQHAHAGQAIRATVTQNIPGTNVRRGSEVLGHVVQVNAAKGAPATLEIRFDAIKIRGRQQIPLKANLRALASPTEVSSASSAIYGPDAGIAASSVETNQIGGDDVYHGGGPVFAGTEKIGKSTSDGVLVLPRSSPGQRCRGVVGGNSGPQAMGPFSSDACGVYGYRIKIAHAGRTDPQGDIVLSSDDGKLNLNSETALLLRVQGS